MALAVSTIIDLFKSARSGDRRSLSKLLTKIESGESLVIQPESGWTLGVTGPPGVGKSTLIGRIIEYWSAAGQAVAVLAVDPTSPVSGGAFLADRIRMGGADSEDSVFVRSLASRNHPGGLMPCLDIMCQVLYACGWSRVIIETVGSGQSEIRIVAFADTVLLVDGPDRGDIIQAEKAGILELADVIAINKADLPNSSFAADAVKGALELSDGEAAPVHLVSAIDGSGVKPLIIDLESSQPNSTRVVLRNRERLITSWDSVLLSHPEIESHMEKLCGGTITVDEAIKSMGSTTDFGGDLTD